jgi:signal transduction histidine kinase
MSSILITLRPWLEPAVAAVFLSLWLVAEAGRGYGGSGLLVLITISAAMAISRVLPVVALAGVASVTLLQVVGVVSPSLSTMWPINLGVLFVVFVVALEASKRVAYAALILGVPLAASAGYLLGSGLNRWTGRGADANEITSFITTSLITLGLYAGAWAIGFALRASLRELRALRLLRTTTEQLDSVEVELMMAHERDRIARDVHDVLAHSLAVVIAQADGARFASVAKPQLTDAAFHAISDAARAALIDVRTLIEGLREEPGDTPQPGLADLEPLFVLLGATGMTVDAQHFGDAKDMTPAQELAVYRIVQESLTNSLRHSGGKPSARLSFDWRGPGLALTVTSRGDSGGPESPGGGHGIRGMKDRARLAGGWLTAGASDEPAGEFVVTLFLPTGVERAVEPAQSGAGA